MSKFSKTFFLSSLCLFVFLALPAFAQVQGLPVVPNADPSQISDITSLINYIYNLSFWIVGIAVFVSVLRAGFIIFFGAAGSSSKIAEGKKIITNAMIGLVILFSSWLILNVINPDLVANTFDFQDLLQGGGSINPFPSITIGGGGTTIAGCVADNGVYSCSASGSTTSCADATGCAGKTCLSMPVSYCGQVAGVGGGTPPPRTCDVQCAGTAATQCANLTGAAYSTCYTSYYTSCVAACGGGGTAAGSCSGVACPGDTLNFCGPVATNCYNSNVSRWDSQIRAGAANISIPGTDTIKMLKAIMARESNGIPGRTSYTGCCYGMYQMKVDTANLYWSRCGLPGPIDRAWLLRSDNVSTQSCLAANYLRAMSSTCGASVMYISAGFNGGGGACQSSGSCSQCTACSGQTGATQRWQCRWENTAHTVCNYTGPSDPTHYKQTRDYSAWVQYCYNSF